MCKSFALLFAIAACNAEASRTPPAPAPAPTLPAADTAGAPGSQNLAPLTGIATRLHAESMQQPGVDITAERLFTALRARGIELISEKQVLAATARASYCALGVIEPSVAVAVCEYASADAARAGKQLLDSRYAKLVPDAVRALRGSTLLTIANASGHPAVRDRVLETFNSL